MEGLGCGALLFYSYIVLGKPYLAIIPGLAIMSLVTAFMLVGNALRDALDVKN